MADLTLNAYLMQGTNAARIAWTPSPAAPASGPELLPIWYETDTGDSYVWDTSGAGAWVQMASSALGSVTSVDVSGGTTGITFSGGPITSSGTITAAGTLAIANGGTGQTSAANAINALVPSQGGNAGKSLTTDGSVVAWSAAGAGTVTSVDVSGGTTGLTTSGGPVTTTGTITFAGTLAAANGGTGLTALGTGVATFLGTPSSANLASAVTDETGSGALVFATSPTLVTPALGTPASGTLTNCTGPWGSQQIAQVVTTGSAATISFSSIPATYSSLEIVFQGRDTNNGGTGDYNASIELNGDTTAGNYDSSQYVLGTGTTASSGTIASSATGCQAVSCPGVINNANAIGQSRITIANYAGTTFHKTVVVQGYKIFGSGPTRHVVNVCFVWKSTAAINAIVLTAGGTAFVDGTTATLYGLK